MVQNGQKRSFWTIFEEKMTFIGHQNTVRSGSKNIVPTSFGLYWPPNGVPRGSGGPLRGPWGRSKAGPKGQKKYIFFWNFGQKTLFFYDQNMKEYGCRNVFLQYFKHVQHVSTVFQKQNLKDIWSVSLYLTTVEKESMFFCLFGSCMKKIFWLFLFGFFFLD